MADATDFTPQDLDSVARTIVTEDAGNPDAIAHVINNRVLSSGLTPHQVVSAPNQFTGWANAGSVDPKSPAYRRAYAAAQDAFTGKSEDPTGGAQFYYNPDLQAELHKTNPGQYKAVPDFAVGDGYRIGKHLYYGGTYTGEAPATASASATPEAPMPSAEDLLAHAQNPAAATPEDGMPSAEELLGQQGAGGKPPAGTVQITPEQALANLKIGEMANRSERYAPVGLSDVVTNSAMFGLQPVVAGGTEALLTGGQNLLAGLGIGKPTGYGMGEAYNAELALEQARLERFGQGHPFQNIVGSTLGAIAGGPAKLGMLAERGALELPGYAAGWIKAPTTTLGKLGQSFLGGAAAGAAQGAGEAASRGESPEDIAGSAVAGGAFGGVTGAVTRPIANAVSGVVNPLLPAAESTLGQRAATATSHAIAGALTTGLGTGGLTLFRTGNPKLALEAGATGALGGAVAGGLGGAVHPTEPPNATPTPRNRLQAYDELIAQGVTPEQVRSGPAGAIAADVVPGAPKILREASKTGALVEPTVRQAYEGQDTNAPSQRVASGLSAGLGTDVTKANTNFDDYQEAQQEKVRQAYDELKDGRGVNTPMLRKAMAVLPAWRDAVVEAARTILGQHPTLENVGWVRNPDYVEPEETPEEAPSEGAAPAAKPTKAKDWADELAAYVKTDAKPRMNGASVRTFVNQQGGIRDAGGEIVDIPGLSRPTGKYAVSGDRMVERVNDAGYTRPDGRPFEDDNDLIQHLNDPSSKENYPATRENQDAMEKRRQVDAAHDQINNELTQTLGLTHHDFSAADLAEFLRTGDITHMERLPEEQVTAEKAERQNVEKQADDFLNPDIKQPKYIPTTDTLLEAVNNYRALQRGGSNPQAALQASRTMGNILSHLDEAIPGFAEARSLSADKKSNADWFSMGKDAANPGRSSDDFQQLKKMWEDPDTDESDRRAFIEGYAGAHGQALEQGKLNFGKIASSPYHNAVRELISGPEGNEQAVQSLKAEQSLKDTQKQNVTGLVRDQKNQVVSLEGFPAWIKRGMGQNTTPGTANALAEVLALPKEQMAAELEARAKDLNAANAQRTTLSNIIRPAQSALAGAVGGQAAGMSIGRKQQPSAIPVGGRYHWAFDPRTNQVFAAPGPAPVVGSNVR